jgi:hypothetical protein
MRINVWDAWVKPVLFDLPEFNDGECSLKIRAVRARTGRWFEVADVFNALGGANTYFNIEFAPDLSEWHQSAWFADDCAYLLSQNWIGGKYGVDPKKPITFARYTSSTEFRKPEWWGELVKSQDSTIF